MSAAAAAAPAAAPEKMKDSASTSTQLRRVRRIFRELSSADEEQSQGEENFHWDLKRNIVTVN